MKNNLRGLSKAIASIVLILGCLISNSPRVLNAQTSLDELEGQALVESLREGGLVVFFRHADTVGMPCDSLYRIGQREGQRNLSVEGEQQSQQIGKIFSELNIPIQEPILAGPVFRARDTAELAFGVDRVEITESLLADDYAGSHGVSWVIREHQRLFFVPPSPGLNRILVGHRTPALIALNGQVSRAGFPEGAAIIMRLLDEGADVLGVVSFVASPNPGIDSC